MDLHDTNQICRGEGLFDTELDGEVVVMHPGNGKYYTLRGSGASLWRLLDRCRTLEEIVDTLCTEYDVTPQQCREDITPFIGELAAEGLLHVVSPETLPATSPR